MTPTEYKARFTVLGYTNNSWAAECGVKRDTIQRQLRSGIIPKLYIDKLICVERHKQEK